MLQPNHKTLSRLHNINKLLESIYKQPLQLSDILKNDGFEDAEIALLRNEHLDQYLSVLLGRLKLVVGNFTKNRHYDIFVSRFGLNDMPIPTLEELAGSYNVSRERVRQLEKTALKRLHYVKAKSSIETTVSNVAREILMLPPKEEKILTLQIMAETLAVCRLDATNAVPEWALKGSFFSMTRTSDELSVVCFQSLVPDGVNCQGEWRGLKVLGPLDFTLTGILSSLATPLAQAGISIFAISTFDTDYLLIKSSDLFEVVNVLTNEGFMFLTD